MADAETTLPSSFPVLSPAEIRVLGSLIEKELTTPDYYPLTLNALTLACNQTSNREPVVSFNEATVVRALDGLREKRLAFLFGGANSRVPRYGHKLESSELGRPELAILCVLMLRGPQTVGEIRTRTARLQEFGSLEEVEALLDALAARTSPALVTKLPRQTGYKEPRYAHLLGGAAELAAPAAEPRLPAPEPATVAVRQENERLGRLEADVETLKQEVADLRRQLAEFRKQFE